MEDKNPWNGYGKSSFHILSYQMFRCSIICTFLTTWIARLALPSPSKQCWDEETLLRQVQCSGVHKLQHCLGERGKGGKIKVDRVNCPKNFVLHFWFSNVSFLSIGYSGILQSTDSKFLMWGITWFWSYLGKYVQFLNNYWDCWQQCRVTVQWREGIVWANCSYISDSISNIFDVWLVHDYFCSLYWCLSYDMNLSTVICWHLAFWNAST